MKKSIYTVWIFAKINAKRFFRDKLSIFFTIAFPLIFLIIFGSLFGGDNQISFNVAVINQSQNDYAVAFEQQFKESDILKVKEDVTSIEDAKEQMKRSTLDATIILNDTFGLPSADGLPSGTVTVQYNQNNENAAIALVSTLQQQINNGVNSKLVTTTVPFVVAGEALKQEGLSQFDYTFAGLLGFAIIGLGIFGPVNVFPELKKQKVLRRLHTTPLKVWEYFVANVASQGIIGVLAIGVLLACSLLLFDLQMKGSFLAFFAFVLFSIIMMYGIGLAIGGWAKNERQAAPLGNLIAFPMIFLSGTFFPRFLMPEWLQGVTNYLPLTPVIDGMRLIAVEGNSLIQVAPQIGIIAAWGLVVYIVAFKVFRWE